MGGELPDAANTPAGDTLAGNVIPGNDLLGSVSDPGQPIGPVFSRDSLIPYAVQKGDTLSGIAEYFGISLDTLANANPDVKAQLIRPGDILNILPTSGVVYQTKSGDTLESVANYFNVPANNIQEFNKSVNFGTLTAGISLVIPGGKAGLASSHSSLPNFNGDFIMPANGYNWGTLHPHNAVDIAASCETPVVASAEGLVVPDPNFGSGASGCPAADTPSSCNGGYGRFVLIEHPFGNNIETRYAHLDKVLVNIGDYVQQGQEVGTMGQTGDATGCHVHFEVLGAQNPFAK
ncbi:MAG TPA: peptidoglycan DD-metalloendopeptidase family protein [Candidatus Paceibacterota bacterium]|nr:peptidoglycan DD-metalloendopeptidase family protein [Candidatus Paceibacterota bacterium]